MSLQGGALGRYGLSDSVDSTRALLCLLDEWRREKVAELREPPYSDDAFRGTLGGQGEAERAWVPGTYGP